MDSLKRSCWEGLALNVVRSFLADFVDLSKEIIIMLVSFQLSEGRGEDPKILTFPDFHGVKNYLDNYNIHIIKLEFAK